MPQKVSLITGAPKYDTLPVEKIIHYPLEQRDYKPFAQARLCCGEENFFLRMWAFEAAVVPGSVLRAHLAFEPGERYLELELSADSHCLRLMEAGRELQKLPPESCRVQHFCGEDLQGIYWGAVAELPRSLLAAHFPHAVLQKGAILRGNLYKECPAGEWEHHGSLFPAEPFAPSPVPYFGEWELVAY